MEKPSISIVIPSYNKSQFIGITLDSILRQSCRNFEIIVQDGGSTDGTFDIVRKYARKYPKIFNIESKRDNGQTSAINIGLKKAKGEIVTYINADDVYTQNAFSEVVKMYSKNPDSLWFAGRGKVIESSGKEIAKPSTLYKNFLLSLNSRFYLLITNYLSQPSVFLTKSAYQKYGPFTGINNGTVMEYSLWLKLSNVSMPIVVPKILSGFRISSGNISSIAYKNTLKEDDNIVRKFTKNKFILFMHKFNNLMRVATIKIISP
ncbi:MAG: glycosyltransferase [Candidatus Microgenomates bacterium]|jgi:glycosyltransferase involved in cell wall biosynthesis